MKDVKDRILEFIAVGKLHGKMQVWFMNGAPQNFCFTCAAVFEPVIMVLNFLGQNPDVCGSAWRRQDINCQVYCSSPEPVSVEKLLRHIIEFSTLSQAAFFAFFFSFQQILSL